MIKYLYVPPELDAVNYIELAKESECLQIIHGESDILYGREFDRTAVSVIEIPTLMSLVTEKNIYEAGEVIKIIFVDEWLREEKYIECLLKVLYVDIEDPTKIDQYEEITMAYDDGYAFYCMFTPEKYGEYIIQIYSKYDDGTSQKKMSKELIVFKREEIKDGESLFNFEL